MKEWNNPQLFSLSLESTFGEKHYCHQNPSKNHAGNHTNDYKSKPQDHFGSKNCLTHNNNCCCSS